MLPILNQLIRRQNEEEAKQRLRLQRRQLRVNSEPFALPEQRFIELFRLSKNLVQTLVENLTPHLNQPKYKSAISIELKIFSTLRFYVTGCYQRSVGEDYHLGLSQTAVHRSIHEVTTAIDTFLSGNINFPRDRREFNEKKANFMAKFQFPGVIGAIDCTHIAVLKPVVEEHNFINRKGYHSLNVQIIYDSNLEILNVNANFPGSSHDAFVWRQSLVNETLSDLYRNGERRFWLIGDSGYPLEPYLMTPFNNPEEGTPEFVFNAHHARARNCVERYIGLLKMRFRCLLKERAARYAPQLVGKMVNACAILHNICIRNDIPLLGDALEPVLNNDINNVEANLNGNILNEGRQVRQYIVNSYFN